MKAVLIFIVAIILTSSVVNAQEVFIDSRDGQKYNTVEIGTQIWMAENMRYETVTESWCPQNTPEHCKEYGRLYTYEIAKNVCPIGWHLPKNEEFTQLIEFLGGIDSVGLKLKEQGLVYWDETTSDVTNSSGFSARGSGNRWDESDFDKIGVWVTYWSSSKTFSQEEQLYNNWGWTLYSDSPDFDEETEDPTMGLSVRCIKD
jgi:uncharacterized protein (TIGR02145 family)